ncbi:MAG: uroporphyrinogen-III synthase [Ginsengibacter sp.]
MQNNVQILSTKKISNSFIDLAEENNICIDELNFIETEESVSEKIKNRIIELSQQNITVIFTSSKALDVVGKIVSPETKWKIFCIEPATKKKVEEIFANAFISGSSRDAEELSQKIIKDNSVKQIVFFCGNQRRDLLPEKLKKNGIHVEELIVYKTIEKQQHVLKNYDGILFFSPSAVRSFFSNNKIEPETVLFTIGKTTAEEVKRFSNNKTVISEIPETEKFITEVVNYFSIKNCLNE